MLSLRVPLFMTLLLVIDISSTPPRTPDACIVTPEDLSLLGSCPRKTPVPKLPLFSPHPPAPLCVSPHPPLRSPPVSSSYLRDARVSGPFFWSSCHQPHPSLFTSVWVVENAALLTSYLSVPIVRLSSRDVLFIQPSFAVQSLWDKAALVGGASKPAAACPQELISAEIL